MTTTIRCRSSSCLGQEGAVFPHAMPAPVHEILQHSPGFPGSPEHGLRPRATPVMQDPRNSTRS